MRFTAPWFLRKPFAARVSVSRAARLRLDAPGGFRPAPQLDPWRYCAHADKLGCAAGAGPRLVRHSSALRRRHGRKADTLPASRCRDTPDTFMPANTLSGRSARAVAAGGEGRGDCKGLRKSVRPRGQRVRLADRYNRDPLFRPRDRKGDFGPRRARTIFDCFDRAAKGRGIDGRQLAERKASVDRSADRAISNSRRIS